MTKNSKRDYYLINSYGISESTYESMVKEQDGKCAICGKYSENLFVDHSHSGNYIRKLLCSNCNTGLGLFMDNPDFLRKAASYVKDQDILHQSKIALGNIPNKEHIETIYEVSWREVRGSLDTNQLNHIAKSRPVKILQEFSNIGINIKPRTASNWRTYARKELGMSLDA